MQPLFFEIGWLNDVGPTSIDPRLENTTWTLEKW